MDFETILFEVRNNIAIITLNRPDKLNALNHRLLSELNSALDKVKSDSAISVVIITGAGEKAFAAGADIKELNTLNGSDGKIFSEFGQQVFNNIEYLGKPVIIAVNGYALGGGCELALSGHIRFASKNAKFGQPEVNLGIIPGYGGTQRLTRLVNRGKAMELILTGDAIRADEAKEIGIVNNVFEADELMEKALETAGKIASKAQLAVRYALDAVLAADEMTGRSGLDYEASLFGVCCSTRDFAEGTSAFLEKRKPNFRTE